ncbi:MFS transporter [Synechococcus sp. MIT S9504]|uniref:MFS transporter n=1 Tax=Synechococcus sp. MIT S9504 TaxID=1801628 RepID=UPI0007BB4744|nr:MFS transporter [Synechococcus sp. MIT S9504]KZR84808.1 Tetracycline resistance protein, class C [Synechococcus sp. MIT S9504]
MADAYGNVSLTCPAAALQRPRIPTLLSAFLTLLNDRLSESIVFPLLPFLLASFNADGRTLGLLAGSYALAQFAATPLIGALSDRFGRRPVIATCVAGSVLGLGLFAITVSMEWPKGALLPLMLLFGARLIDGFSGGTAATAGAVLADITPEEQRARAFGLIGVAFGLGFIIGPFVGGQLARINVTVPIWVATGFALVNLLVVLGLLPETHPRTARQAMPRKRDLNPFAQIAKVIGNPAVGRLCLGFFLFFLAFNGFTAILVLYFKQRFNWGPELATTAFLIVGVVATVVQGGLIGPLVKRLGEWKLTLTGLGLVILGCLLIPSTDPQQAQAGVFSSVAILATGTGLVTPSLRSLVSRRLDSEGQGTALGSLQALQSLGSFLGPPLAGLSYDLLGQISPFVGSACLLIMVMLLVGGSPLPSRTQ